MFETVTIVGLGHVGMPLAMLALQRCCVVRGVEKNGKTCQTKQAEFKASLDGLPSYQNVKFEISTEANESDVFVIAVPTPLDHNRTADLTSLYCAVDKILPVLKQGNLVVVVSTCPVGTCRKIHSHIHRNRTDLLNQDQHSLMHVAVSPERSMGGEMHQELSAISRLVGGIEDHSIQQAVEFFENKLGINCLSADAETVELAKIVENTYRSVNIAFANDIEKLSRTENVDFDQLRELVNTHPRVEMHQAGIGVGGHCLPVDPHFANWQISPNSIVPSALEALERRVDEGYQALSDKLEALNVQSLITVGLTYKENVPDVRNSPALTIAKRLQLRFKGETFRATDPCYKQVALDLPTALKRVIQADLSEPLESDAIAFLAREPSKAQVHLMEKNGFSPLAPFFSGIGLWVKNTTS